MGGWGLGNPNLVRNLKTVRNIGRPLMQVSFWCYFPPEMTQVDFLMKYIWVSWLVFRLLEMGATEEKSSASITVSNHIKFLSNYNFLTTSPFLIGLSKKYTNKIYYRRIPSWTWPCRWSQDKRVSANSCMAVREYCITGLHFQKAYTHSDTSCSKCAYQIW